MKSIFTRNFVVGEKIMSRDENLMRQKNTKLRANLSDVAKRIFKFIIKNHINEGN